MRRELSAVLPALATTFGHGGDPASVFVPVKAAMSLLEPLKIATKIVESDNATHLDVICVLVGLRQHLGNSGEESVDLVNALDLRTSQVRSSSSFYS